MARYVISISVMKPRYPSEATYRLALPCYENRIMPRFGIARSFVLVDIQDHDNRIEKVTRHTWEPDTVPNLPNWLRQQHVDGILCGGIHPRFQIALEAAGLWVIWGFRGDIDTVLNQWMDSDNRQTMLNEYNSFVSCCRVQHPMECSPSLPPNCKRRKKT